jgi:hypothetical protein
MFTGTCLAMDVSSDFTIPAFGSNVTILIAVLMESLGKCYWTIIQFDTSLFLINLDFVM